MERKITVIPASRQKSGPRTTRAGQQRVAAYCRVSTDHEEQLGSFANQVEYYTNLINSKPEWTMAGLFSDEGISGTGTKKRSGFQDMIRACDEGRVDLVITKSISRFARNTADCLRYSRHLKNKGIPIIFEKESINTMDASGELLFTILSSLAQEESRNISENSAWGIRSKFQQGIPHLNTNSLLGYDKDENGNLVINEDQAVIVRRVYREFLEGWSTSEIANHLNAEGVLGVRGVAKWVSTTIERMLKNEVHVGDLLMQKSYTVDFLTKKAAANKGELEQYYIRDDHPAIIPREDWEAVQQELERRAEFKQRHGIKTEGSCREDPFYSKLFCAHCGGKYVRKNYKGIKAVFWKCDNTGKAKGHICSAQNVTEAALQEVFVKAWNQVVAQREEHMAGWTQANNALSRYRARTMIALAETGPVDCFVPEMARAVLEEIRVISPTEFEICFLDGTEVKI